VTTPPPQELLRRLQELEAGRILLAGLPSEPPVYLVGGAVRDLLRGHQPSELDLVLEGDAVALARRIAHADVVAHDRFGTATIRLDGHSYDIASARREIYEHPGALPTVAPAPLQEDLGRRDFTVNAIAMALDSGDLEAFPGALEDLDRSVLRVLHERSFSDDPTRLLRLARYAARLQFSVEPRTAELARSAVRERALETVSGARTGAELRLLAREPDPSTALEALKQLELDRAIHPRFGLADPQAARSALELLPPDGRRDLLVLAAAAQEVPLQQLRGLLDRLAFEAPERERITAAATRAPALAERLRAARRPSEIAAAASDAAPELVALAGAHGAAQQAKAWVECLRHVQLEIDGQDLIAAGVPEGPQIGRALTAALAAKLDGRATGREAELREALAAVR
jgi:tRNA nucleotidyltransferase (CCA-adding enzyme)